MNYGKINLAKANAVVERIINLGVKDYVILHFPEAAIACDAKKQKFISPSINVPSELIKGSAGAGDACAAGVLLGLHENQPITDCLKFGACAAAASLADESCSDAVRSIDEVLKLESKYGFKDI